MAKRALITGISGQDGSYLAELLLDKGYEVHGTIRRVALEDPHHRMSRLMPFIDRLKLHSADIQNYSRVIDLFAEIQPQECYHLAAQSFVHESFEDSFSTMDINISGAHNLLAALHRRAPKCKFYFAGSSEMFGKASETPQTENTRFHPRSPYGVSKVTGFELTRNYREAYSLFACSGILFNHESPRRGFEFVTRKITQGIARIKNGKDNLLVLGNLDAKRDWGFAGDYVVAMWQMLQNTEPSDYVIATGKNHSVKEFVDLAFKIAGLNYEPVNLHETDSDKADKELRELKKNNGCAYVVQHPEFYRPAEVHELLGDASKAKKTLGWAPKVSFEELVSMMVLNDLNQKIVQS